MASARQCHSRPPEHGPNRRYPCPAQRSQCRGQPPRPLRRVDRLLAPELWDPGVVIPAFAAVLRDVGPAVPASDLDAQLVRRIVDGLRDRPSLPHVPLLFECMEDTEASWLNMQIHGLLFAWLAGGDVSSVALQARPARRSWRQLWDPHGDARLLPRGRDWPAGAADRR